MTQAAAASTSPFATRRRRPPDSRAALSLARLERRITVSSISSTRSRKRRVSSPQSCAQHRSLHCRNRRHYTASRPPPGPVAIAQQRLGCSPSGALRRPPALRAAARRCGSRYRRNAQSNARTTRGPGSGISADRTDARQLDPEKPSRGQPTRLVGQLKISPGSTGALSHASPGSRPPTVRRPNPHSPRRRPPRPAGHRRKNIPRGRDE